MKIIRQYGPNKIENSSLCFGTMQFGDEQMNVTARKCMRHVEKMALIFLILLLFILEEI